MQLLEACYCGALEIVTRKIAKKEIVRYKQECNLYSPISRTDLWCKYIVQISQDVYLRK